MNRYLIKDPEERMLRTKEKEEWCLDFLKDEIYSTTKILSYQMAVEERAARIALNRMVKRGLLVRDEVRFMEGRALPIWGISNNGLLSVLEPDEIAGSNLRYHTPGRVSPLTIAHTIDVQTYRTHCEIRMDYEGWTPTRLLPALNKKRGHPQRWAVYPDAVALMPIGDDRFCKVAVEVERTRKTPQRYVQIIKGHFSNIEEGRYKKVFYVCSSQKMADGLAVLFLRLIEEKKISLYFDEYRCSTSEKMSFFSFETMPDY